MYATVDRMLLSSSSVGSRNNDELLVSHLLFGDDTLIFYVANREQLRHLCCLFLCFEVFSELKIHLSNSEMVLVGDVDNVESLTSILGSKVAFLSMMCLGLPLGTSYKNTSIWNDI